MFQIFRQQLVDKIVPISLSRGPSAIAQLLVIIAVAVQDVLFAAICTNQRTLRSFWAFTMHFLVVTCDCFLHLLENDKLVFGLWQWAPISLRNLNRLKTGEKTWSARCKWKWLSLIAMNTIFAKPILIFNGRVLLCVLLVSTYLLKFVKCAYVRVNVS